MTKIGQINSAWMTKTTAKSLDISENDKYLGVPVVISNTVANNCVFINANHSTQGGGQT